MSLIPRNYAKFRVTELLNIPPNWDHFRNKSVLPELHKATCVNTLHNCWVLPQNPLGKGCPKSVFTCHFRVLTLFSTRAGSPCPTVEFKLWPTMRTPLADLWRTSNMKVCPSTLSPWCTTMPPPPCRRPSPTVRVRYSTPPGPTATWVRRGKAYSALMTSPVISWSLDDIFCQRFYCTFYSCLSAACVYPKLFNLSYYLWALYSATEAK